MRIGVFGGSFDPPHRAHASVAKAAQAQLNLERLIWVPTFSPPHKIFPAASFEHRLGMVQALIGKDSGILVSDIESSLPQPSYTLQTLRALKAGLGLGHAWYLLVGADNASTFSTWHQPEAVLAEASLAVYPRQGVALTGFPSGSLILNCPEIHEESRQLRELLSSHPDQALAQLPEAVAKYIRQHGLYGLNPETLA